MDIAHARLPAGLVTGAASHTRRIHRLEFNGLQTAKAEKLTIPTAQNGHFLGDIFQKWANLRRRYFGRIKKGVRSRMPAIACEIPLVNRPSRPIATRAVPGLRIVANETLPFVELERVAGLICAEIAQYLRRRIDVFYEISLKKQGTLC
jgi:hypothetical protein